MYENNISEGYFGMTNSLPQYYRIKNNKIQTWQYRRNE